MMQNFKRCLLIVLIAFTSYNIHGHSHAAEKVRIAVFQWKSSEAIYTHSLEGIIKALAEQGYQIGGNLAMDTFEARGNNELAQQLIDKIRNSQYNLVLSLGTESTKILMEYNLKNKPVVFSGVFDPVQAGLVSTMNGSRTNYTGTAHRQPLYKQFELYKKFVPSLKRIGVIYGRNEPSANYQLTELEQEKKNLALTDIISKPVSSLEEMNEAVSELAGKVDAIYLPADSTMTDSNATNSIANQALKYKIPVFSGIFDPVKQGVLASAYTNVYQLAKEAGKMAALILQGEDPGSIPIAYQYTPSFGLNLHTLKELDIKMPEYMPVKINNIISKHFAFMIDDTTKLTSHNIGPRLPLDTIRGNFQLTMKGEPLEEILDEIREVSRIAGINLSFTKVGALDTPMHATIQDNNLPSLINHLIRKADFLAVQRQEVDFTIYGAGAEDVLKDRGISYIHRFKALSTETALEKMEHYRERLKIYSIKETTSMSLTGPLTDIQEAVSFLESIDYQKPIISIELLIVQYRHGNHFKWGIDIINGQYGHFSKIQLTPGEQLPINITYNVTDALKPSLALNLHQLIEDGRARVITNPHLAVRNSEKAAITLLQKKYIQMATTDHVADVTSYTLTELEAGVNLEVVPTLTDNELILLAINGELSVFIESAIQGEYAIDRNTINTSVNIYNGQTLIIGGLIKKEESENESGVPLLKDIWLVGNLFKTKAKQADYVETVLYITPRINTTNGANNLQLRTHYIAEMEEEERKMNRSKK